METQSACEFQVCVDTTNLQKCPQLLHSQTKNLRQDSCQIQKVSPQIRRRVQGIEQIYDPMMVSIGPYHHGKPELHRAEEFKHLCLDRLVGDDEKKKAFFYSKIVDQISEIRDIYMDVEKYNDEALACMMLLDVSMIIDFMHNFMDMNGSSYSAWDRCLGVGSGFLMVRDMVLIENQIPFRVLKLLISLLYGREESAFLVSRFLSKNSGIMELNHAAIPEEIEDPPVHLLEVFWRLMVMKHKGSNSENRFSMIQEMHSGSTVDSYTPPRSVMDLKANGIHVRPNSTRQMIDITFRPNVCFSELYLPVQIVSALTPVVWSNMIAFELLPDSKSSPIFLSVALFLKSLIQTPEDVKELQERGVILNMLGNLEKVVEVHKEIDTFGLYDLDVFKDVKREIEEHCRSRAKTWLAELIYTRFQTPWTAIALFAAVILLCLTFLQTFFTIHR